MIYSSLVAMWRPMRSRHDIVEESLEIPGSPQMRFGVTTPPPKPMPTELELRGALHLAAAVLWR